MRGAVKNDTALGRQPGLLRALDYLALPLSEPAPMPPPDPDADDAGDDDPLDMSFRLPDPAGVIAPGAPVSDELND
jgi:hypothetical protein